MRARWVQHNPAPELPIVAQTRVAHSWPWKYYFVSTIWMDPSKPLARLTRSLETGIDYKDVTPGPDVYVRQVFDGWPKSMDYTLYEREYCDLTQAKLGHEETVGLLAQGRLKLQRIRYKLEDKL
jgi:hypothetical protein